jgi:hypothetical protein
MGQGFSPPNGDATRAFEQKAQTCARILGEAEKLARIGALGAPLLLLVFRANDILDDLDELLLTRHPLRDKAAFAEAAALHRQLERIQAAIPSSIRGQLRHRAPAPSQG